MEANCEKVLAATEKVRRRTSKWDVPEEHHVETEVKINDVLPAKVDDTFMDHTELDSPKPSLTVDVDVSEIDKSTNKSGKVSDNNIIQSDVICEMPQNPKQFDLEGEYKDEFEKHDQDHVLKKQTMSDNVENWDKPLKGTYEMPPGPNERRQRTRSISPIDGRLRLDRKRNRSRSPPYDSRSGSWSRSRSPSYSYRQGSERSTNTGRMRGMPICRDFTAGRCQRDDCRFLHEGGGGSRQIDRHYHAGSVDGRGSRSDKGNHSRDKFSRRQDDPSETGRDNTESHRDYRVSSNCFDFTKGRCHRGASCRYVHHGSSSDGGWNARDESRGRSHERNDRGNSYSTSFSQRQELRPVSEVPCKFFLENQCRHGESCRFSHHVKPANIPVAMSVDSELHDQIAHFVPPLSLNGQMQQIMHSNLHNQFPALLPTPNSHYFNASLLSQPSKPMHYELNPQNLDSQVQVQNLLKQSQNESSYNLNAQIQQNVPPIHNLQNLPDFIAGVPIQQNVPPIHNVQNPIQQNVPLIHNAQNQSDFNSAVPPKQNFPPSHNAQNQPNFNFGVPIQQNIPLIHNAQNQSDFNVIVPIQPNISPIQPNVSPIHNAQNQTDFNLGVLIQQNVPPIHKAQNQTDLNLGVLIPQNVPPIQKAQNQADFSAGVPVQHNVPPTQSMQNQSDFIVGAPIQQNLASDPGHSHQDVTVPSHISDAKKLTENNQTSVLQHVALKVSDSSETKPKPSQTNSDNPIINKVVTSEQAAKIIDLSASLAQFFGTAALNSQSTAGMTPQPFLNPDSLSTFTTSVAPLPTEAGRLQANLSRPIPSEEKPRIQQVTPSTEREAKKPEASRISKDQTVQLPNDDEEGKKSGDNRKIKEGKDVRMFKCALIEFVKEMLKPKWKEGQLSKEAHKTIVKKVVDKVSGSLQGVNVPQTQEKIDLYLLNSKPKLSKLVQAYVEKYVKS